MSTSKGTLALIWYSSFVHALRCSGGRERDVVTDPLVQGVSAPIEGAAGGIADER